MKIIIPPIKSQGIKTKLVIWINSIVPNNLIDHWIEPFMGTGVVAFNTQSKYFILCDSNPHLISFYQSIINGKINHLIVRQFLEKEGTILTKKGKEHYYKIRDRFNQTRNPLDFLFLNRAGFNGMIHFNKRGRYNIPFCNKPERFSKAYITKITNQVASIKILANIKSFTFKNQSFQETISSFSNKKHSIIYCDPPYIGRHADYYNTWDEKCERTLYNLLLKCKSRFILSTWHHNKFRRNKLIDSLWKDFNIVTKEHFYHVLGNQKNRNSITEAIITNFDFPISKTELNKDKIN